ncbi:MAG: potassium/proton antiporter [Solirubrobacterales bacterium]|nr:potassium/proton antiporter [Solirubrobacterales bacterium]
MSDGRLILIAGALLSLGLLASLLAGRLRVPGLVLFLAVGMIVGSEGLGLINFEDYGLARTIGVIALALILFEGGLTTGMLEIRPVLAAAISLALIGTLATAVIVGLAAVALFDFSTLEGLLVGAIVASTDGAAIFGLLRTSTLRRKLARTLEGEAGFNDPVAILLVIGFTEWLLKPDYGVGDMALLFVGQLGIGAAVGWLVGWGAVQAFQRARLETAGLYPVASLATVALAYGGADVLDGSGFLAVYLAGLALGTAHVPAKRTVTSFHEGMAWVAQLVMFLTLGLLVFPSRLLAVAAEGTLLALVLVLVARPAATWLSTAFGGFSNAERAVLSWAGLRGAVPVVLATFPVIEGVDGALNFFNIVFFAVLLSTLLQGTTFEPLARRLNMTTSEPALPTPLSEAGTIRRLGAEILEFPIGPTDAIAGARVRDLGLPRDAVVNVIVRDAQAIPPRGSTRLLAGDSVHVMLRQEMARQVPALLERWRRGPIGPVARPRPTVFGRRSIFVVRPWGDADGDPARPEAIAGVPVVEQLRIRRDKEGALSALADGRYGVSGPLLVVGAREDLERWTRRKLATGVTESERAWLQTVIAALAADTAPARPAP